jgi:hypothetical protein
MAVVTNRRPRTTLVKKADVDHVGQFLQELPEKPKEDLSLREAVSDLRTFIQAALAKGYTYDELATILSAKGIEISPSTLKNYVPSGKRQASREKQTVPKIKAKRIKKNKDLDSIAIALESGDSELSALVVNQIDQAAGFLSTEIASDDSLNGTALLESSTSETEEDATPAPEKSGRKRGGARTAAKTKSETTTEVEPKPKSITRRPSTRSASKTSSTRGRRKLGK